MNAQFNKIYKTQIEESCCVEIYRALGNDTYPHTDTIDYISDNINDIPEVDITKMYIELMGEEKYNRTILANSGLSFREMYEEDDKVLVVIIPNK